MYLNSSMAFAFSTSLCLTLTWDVFKFDCAWFTAYGVSV